MSVSSSSSIPSRSGRTKKHLVFRPAPVLARFVAALADLFLIGAFGAIVAGIWAVATRTSPVGAVVVAILVGIIAREAALAQAGITPGMVLMHIRMVDRFTGGRPGLRALVHSAITGGIVLMTIGIGAGVLVRSMLKDSHRVGWHDHVSDVRVISTNASIPPEALRLAASSHTGSPGAGRVIDTSTSSHRRGQVIIDSVPWSSAPIPVDPPIGHTSRSSSIISPSFASPLLGADAAERAQARDEDESLELSLPAHSESLPAHADVPDDAAPSVQNEEAASAQAADSDEGAQPEPSAASTGEVPMVDTDAAHEHSDDSAEDAPQPQEDAEELLEIEEEPRTETLEISEKAAALQLAAVEGGDESPTIRLVPLAGGEPLTISTVTVVGRQPENISEVAQAQLCAINDKARSVSKTHALLIPAETSLWVMDLHSTNGTYITINGTTKRVESMLPAPQGAIIAMGRASFRVE